MNTPASEVERLVTLKQDFLDKRLAAEKAAYTYFCACRPGADKENAYEAYVHILNSTRRF